MYTVCIFWTGTGEAITERHFEFGTWKEIGLWLDFYGYNSPDYYCRVTFSETKTS